MESNNKKTEDNTTIDLDYVLVNEIGQFGKYQLRNIFLVSLLIIFSAFMFGDYIFTASKLPHRCLIPECDDISKPEYDTRWVLNAIPATGPHTFHDCKRYAYTTVSFGTVDGDDICSVAHFNRSETTNCESYVYERKNSVVYDFGLECQEWLRALAGMLNSVGNLIALPVAGFVSDRWGRRVTVVFSIFSMAVVGFIRAFSNSYAMYAILQFIQTAIGGGAFSAGYILAMELVGPKFRVATGAVILSTFTWGQVLLGLIAWCVPEWRTLTLVLHLPMFILVIYYWILTESVRWLISKHKFDEAKKVLQKVAKLNSKQISAKTMEAVLTPPLEDTNKDVPEVEINLFMRIIRSPTLLRRCCTTFVWWITMTFVYYGLSINSVGLSGNMYVNYIATAAIDFPGYWTAVLALDRIGRRITLLFGFLLNGVCCLGFAFMPTNLPMVSLALFLFGKFCIAAVATSLYLYTSELYPTRHRHSLLAFSSMVGRLGSITAPLTPPLMQYWQGAPSAMFGGMALLSGLLVLTQPETLGVKFPDTIEEAECLVKNKQIPLNNL